MRLSEAILLGSTLHRQATWRFRTLRDGEIRTCVLGAAMAAVGQLESATIYTVREAFPLIQQSVRWQGRVLPIIAIITQLNDVEGWTREQIAEWVATVEPAETPEPQPRPEPQQECVAHGL